MDDDRQLTRYLRDHRAGAAAGVALVRHCARANDGTELGRAMAGLAEEIDRDCRTLEAIMIRLGLRPSKLKVWIGTASERVGRLKINDQLVHYSNLSRLVELEGLAAGIETKRNLWRALLAVVDDHAGLDAVELDRLVQRASAQLELVRDHHRQAAAAAL